MRIVIYSIIGVLVVVGAFVYAQGGSIILFAPNDTQTPTRDVSDTPQAYAENLHIPWELVTLPNGDVLISERPGTLTRISKEHTSTIVVPDVSHTGEGGLLGIAPHPDFSENNWLYLYQTTETDSTITNQVVRYTFKNNQLTNQTVLVSDIPGAAYHDGGRIAFGPDGYLYVTTGDGGVPARAQNRDSLAGKILRMTDTGAVPTGNPFPDSLVYSYGHRNPQGLAWDSDGNLWSTEHGRSGVQSGLDELNLITPGNNYGWPVIEGDETAPDMVTPVLHSGPDTTWAPGSLVAVGDALYWGGLRGEAIYQVDRHGQDVANLVSYFSREYGRIRTIRVTPTGILYFLTSNTDGRGTPQPNDDKVYGIHMNQL